MLLQERPVADAPPAAPEPRSCERCGSELADVQEWCLECGERQPSRSRWTWRIGALVVAGVIVLAGGGSALAYVALRDNASEQSASILAATPPASGSTTTPGVAAANATAEGVTPTTSTPAAPAPKAHVHTPKTPSTTTPNPPPLVPVPIQTPTTSTPTTSTPSTTTTGTTTTHHHSASGTHHSSADRLTQPKRPPDQGQRYAKGFSPQSAVDYDPFGDGHENPSEVRGAIDRNLNTGWDSEEYPTGLGKPGVGIFVDAGSQVDLRAMEVATATPGWTFSIYGNAAYPTGPMPGNGWQLLAQGTMSSSQNGIGLSTAGAKFEYYLVWATSLPPQGRHVAINEVTLLSADGSTP